MEISTIKISFLITHFNRPLDLFKCINAIKKIPIVNYEIVVSDDCSETENVKLLQDYEIDKLVLSDENQGLASNINKGIKACDGEYIIYCQEDFLLNSEIIKILPECLGLLNSQKADMIRLMAYYEFKKLIPLTSNVSLIPKFSFQNFLLSPYQYSDHPFIIKNNFYEKFGYYMGNTSGDYGETEYAIRILKSKAKIAIVANRYAVSIIGSKSVIDRNVNTNFNYFKISKSILKYLRALRLYLECFLYNNSKRGLMTYKNFRK